MIATISPSIICTEDTINTLKYANRAKNIKVNMKRNVKETDIHISKYDDIINALKSEIEYLRVHLNAKSVSPSSINYFLI
jgi:kinesin family protein 18/19